MISREQVIRGLECLIQRQEPTANPCKGCGYINRPNFAICVKDIASDAYDLLKEQDAVEPRRDANCVMMFRCGVCGEYVGFIDSDPGDPNEQDNYCRNCGRKVKWE